MRPARAVAGSLVANGLILACGVATGVLAARLLGPEDRGLLAALLFWPQLIASLATLSFNEAATVRIGRAPTRSGELAAAAVGLALPLSIAAVAGALVAIPVLLGSDRQTWWHLARWYAVLFIPANLVSLALLSRDQGLLRFSAYNGYRLGGPVMYLAGLLLLWAAGRVTVTAVVMVSVLSVVAVTVTQLARVRPRGILAAARSDGASLLRQGLSFHGATLLMILSAQADRIVVLQVFDDETIGYYVVAFALASLGLSAVAMAFQTVMLPSLARLTPDRRPDMLAKGLRASMLILVVTSATVALAAPVLVVFFFGAAYAPAGTLARLLSLAMCFAALRSVTVISLRGLGDGRSGAIAELISLATFAVICLPLAMEFGPSGMALAIGTAAVPSLLYLAARLKQQHGVAAGSLWGLRPSTARECIGALRSLRGS